MSEKINNQTVFSLFEVLNSVQKTIAKRYQNAYWMKAEMNKLNFYSYSGHCYPDLVQKSNGKVVAQARAIIWSSDFQFINQKFLDVLKEPLKDGITILFHAKITFTPSHGLSLQILDIDPSYALGILEKEKLENIQKLKQEGFFDLNKQLNLPLLPQKIAIISVETSKGYADFIKVLNKNPKGYQFHQTLFPARLQGESAVTDITKQLKKIKAIADHFDIVTIIRGGGGDVGLSAFNDFSLAKEVATFPIPIITGIGHATNETIVEMVAYRNAITPTACALFLLEKFEAFDLSLQKYQKNLVHFSRMHLKLHQEKQNFQIQLLQKSSDVIFKNEQNELNNSANILLSNSFEIIKMQKENIIQIPKMIVGGAIALMKSENMQLRHFEKSIALINPENILKRGFSITKYKGKIIKQNDALPASGEALETILTQGSIISIVKKTQQKETEDDRTKN